MSSSRVRLEEYLIPSEEIDLATRNYSSENIIVMAKGMIIYRGQLSQRWQNRIAAFKSPYHDELPIELDEFLNTVDLMSTFNHENINPFIGYCVERRMIVTEYASNRSLVEHLNDPDKRRSLTWAQRLKICLGAAAGLEYLHSGLGEGRSVIHRNIQPGNILLDENLEAKLSASNMSIILVNVLNQPSVDHESSVRTSKDFYLDPLYKEVGSLKTESDVYSFGVVLFEVLSGMLAHETKSVVDNQRQTLISLVRRYHEEEPDNLIDPCIRDDINIRSFRVFKKIAYQCISWNSKDRPTMSTIVKRIQEALDIQNHKVASTVTVPSHQHQSLESFFIPLEEILMATQHFSYKRAIRRSEKVYKIQLPEKWQKRTAVIKCFYRYRHKENTKFPHELKMVSSLHHENVIGFIGYCDKHYMDIIVYDYAINGSLDRHLYGHEFNKRGCLTWAQRLQICIGAARGLEYLHSCLGEDVRVIHRKIKTKNILLDDNLEAKISHFSLSLSVDKNQPQVYDVPEHSSYYRDPIYEESGLVNTKADIYSFGVVMLETLSGMKAVERTRIRDAQPETLVHLVRNYYDHGLDILIDPLISHQINIHSFRVFMKTVYQCISLELEDRPTLKRVIKRIEEAQDFQKHEGASAITTRSGQHQNLEKFRISRKEIDLAIKDFSLETPIGDGGYGKVYQAKLSEQWQNSMVAIKCLDPKGHQGKKEFLNEVKLISSFHHRNIISFIGYCDEDDQMIIVSKYAANGSLDHHLQNPSKRDRLTWAQRLRICLGAAKGLEYLHSGLGKDNMVIHRDIKSGNILLDENMEAKICDFGLSKQGSKNQQDTKGYTKVAGTNFYLDPLYRETDKLSRESDVYSFGVVLFEMLRGMMAYQYIRSEDGDPQHLISLVRRYYKDEPRKLIDPVIRDEIDNDCFHKFRELAYRCISLNSEERPTMDRIIDRIEDAIDLQEHEVYEIKT